jgi:hypothetical protein
MIYLLIKRILITIFIAISSIFNVTNVIEPKYESGRVLESRYYLEGNYVFADFSGIQNNWVSRVNGINNFFDRELVIGVYGEVRGLYSSQNNDLHLGIDLFVEPGTDVVAPFDLEVFGVYHSKSLSGGVGGVVTARVPISQLSKNGFETPSSMSTLEHFYIQFLHLTQSTLLNYAKAEDIEGFYSSSGNLQFDRVKNLSLQNPRIIKKGDLIGKVGKREENGGWPEHLHLQYITSLNEFTRIPSRPWMVGAAKKLDNTIDPTLFMGLSVNSGNKLKFTCSENNQELVCKVI